MSAAPVSAAGTGAVAQASAANAPRPCLVLDTNIVLDMWVFHDAATQPLRQAVQAGAWDWLATTGMRAELARVLTYPKVQARLARAAGGVERQAADAVNAVEERARAVLAAFDAHTRCVDAPAKARVTCSDPDDQAFIDLAVAHRCCVISKDKAVTSMKKRLETLGATAQAAIK